MVMVVRPKVLEVISKKLSKLDDMEARLPRIEMIYEV